MFSSLAIFVLGDAWVYVCIIDCSDIASNVEVLIN